MAYYYLPAIGVATLSGLTLHFREKRMTPTMTSPRAKLAIEAVTIADAHNNKAWSKSNDPATVLSVNLTSPYGNNLLCLGATLA